MDTHRRRRGAGLGVLMGKHKSLPCFKQAVSAMVSDLQQEHLVRVISNGEGRSTIVGFGAALMAQSSKPDAQSKLAAYRNAIDIAVLHDREQPLPSAVQHVLVDLRQMLDDMQHRRSHPLVDFASKPGRRGATEDCYWRNLLQVILAAAARGRMTYAERFPSEAEEKSAALAGAWVWKQITAEMKRNGVILEDEIRGGDPARIGTDWPSRFKGDESYQYRLQLLSTCNSKEDLHLFVQALLFEAARVIIRNFVADAPSKTKKEKARKKLRGR